MAAWDEGSIRFISITNFTNFCFRLRVLINRLLLLLILDHLCIILMFIVLRVLLPLGLGLHIWRMLSLSSIIILLHSIIHRHVHPSITLVISSTWWLHGSILLVPSHNILIRRLTRRTLINHYLLVLHLHLLLLRELLELLLLNLALTHPLRTRIYLILRNWLSASVAKSRLIFISLHLLINLNRLLHLLLKFLLLRY